MLIDGRALPKIITAGVIIGAINAGGFYIFYQKQVNTRQDEPGLIIILR